MSLEIVILGLSLSSSWGNGHATTFRALVRQLHAKGHSVTFLERDVPWYANHRDLPEPDFCRLELYENLEELRGNFGEDIATADLVIVGSYVPEGVAVGDLVMELAAGITAFYDIDTPVTLSALAAEQCEYIDARQIPLYDLYLSFSGGRALDLLAQRYKSPAARPLYCSVDPHRYGPVAGDAHWDLGYMGTYSQDRQPLLEMMLLDAARDLPDRRFIVAGPQYPGTIEWPANVERIEHLPPDRHCSFYNAQRYTLNLTRADMVRLGHSPSVRLFEAAACEVPIISDYWPGLEDFFAPGREILIAGSKEEVERHMLQTPEDQRIEIAHRARLKILARHTAEQRAEELLQYYAEARAIRAPRRRRRDRSAPGARR